MAQGLALASAPVSARVGAARSMSMNMSITDTTTSGQMVRHAVARGRGVSVAVVAPDLTGAPSQRRMS
jgi:hypothetical protein